MLPYTKSTISGCTPSEITRHKRYKLYLNHTAIQTIVISTYIHGKAQTPLSQFVVKSIIQIVCNKYTKIEPMELEPQCIGI